MDALRAVDTIIIDEIHALVPTKRGAHLALSLERLEAFCERHFLVDETDRARAFARICGALEQVDGLLHELHRELRRPMDTDTGELGPVDLLFANMDLFAHVEPDLFRTKVAFLALLNFPVHRLEERLRDGGTWSPHSVPGS